MSRMQRVQLTPQKSPSLAPDANGTVRVPIRRIWLFWRMAGAVFALIVSGYALIMQGIHYGDVVPRLDIADIAKEKLNGRHSVDPRRLFEDATNESARVQNAVFHQWPLWSFGITAFVLLLASRTLFLEFGRLQSDEPGLIVSPRALTVNIDANRRKLNPIPWTAISDVELRRIQGLWGVTIRIREPGHVMYDGFFSSRLPNTGRTAVDISPTYLASNAQKLKQLLDGYLPTHTASPTPPRST
jgi:hypothetical protein